MRAVCLRRGGQGAGGEGGALSNKIVNAIRALVMSPTQKFVLHCLADEANDQGHCYPSVSAIMEKTCMGDRTVRRAIADLEAMNLIVANRRDGRATLYDLTPAVAAGVKGHKSSRRKPRTPAGQAGAPLPERQNPPISARTPAAAAEVTHAGEAGDPAGAAGHPCRSGRTILDPPEIPYSPTTTAGVGLWEQFALVYPHKGRLDEARAIWLQLSEADQRRALAVVKDQVGKPVWQREAYRYVPAADKWLAKRQFANYPNPLERAGAASSEPPAPLTAEARAAGSAQAKAARAAIAGRVA